MLNPQTLSDQIFRKVRLFGMESTVCKCLDGRYFFTPGPNEKKSYDGQICVVCHPPRAFATRRKLVNHEGECHSRDKFTCQICLRSFASSTSLRAHARDEDHAILALFNTKHRGPERCHGARYLATTRLNH